MGGRTRGAAELDDAAAFHRGGGQIVGDVLIGGGMKAGKIENAAGLHTQAASDECLAVRSSIIGSDRVCDRITFTGVLDTSGGSGGSAVPCSGDIPLAGGDGSDVVIDRESGG